MMNVTNLSDFYALKALAYVHKHDAEHLQDSQITERVIEYLQIGFSLSTERAEQIAIRAVCEYQSRKTSLYIDIDSSNSTMLVLNDTRRNVRRVIPVTALANLLSTAQLAPVRTPSYVDAMSGKSLPDTDDLVFNAPTAERLTQQR